VRVVEGGEPKVSQKRSSTRRVTEPEASQSGTVETAESVNQGAKSDPEVSQKRAKNEPPRARAFSSPETDSNPEADSEINQENVPPVPVATPSPATPEPPACAPPPAIQASAPESMAKEATNTQPGLFGQTTAATVDIPKKQKKAATKVDNAEAVGKVWACYREFHPRSGEKPPTADEKLIRTALADWTADQLCMVVKWAHTSDHERATFLRNGGYTGISNLLVANKIGTRLELAEAGSAARPHQTPEPVAPPEDPAAIWEEMIRLRSRGIRVCPEDIPSRTKDAIRAAGGWNQLGLLNEYTERQARTTFITAYRNNIPPVNGHPRNA